MIVRRSIGSPILFTIVYSSLASAIYFSLGVIAGHALGLTPVVFLIAALLFTLTAHDLRGGRLAAPGSRRLDGVRALRVQRARQLHRRLGDPARLRDPDRRHGLLGDPVPEGVLASAGQQRRGAGLSLAFIALVVLSNIRGFGSRRGWHRLWSRRSRAAGLSWCSASCCSSTRTRCGPIHLGSAPTWSHLVFAMTLAVIAFTSLESASGLAGEVRQPRGPQAAGREHHRRGRLPVRRHRAVAVTALPVHGAQTALAARYLNAPVIGIVTPVTRTGLARLRYRGRDRSGHACGSRQLGHARAFAPGLLAVHQPPDPQRPWPAAPAALDPVRADHARGRARGRAGDARGPRLPCRHLRLRRDARVHDRAPVDLPPALPRARPRPSIQDPALGADPGRAAAAAGRARGVVHRGGWWRCWSCTTPRDTSALPGWPLGSPCT